MTKYLTTEEVADLLRTSPESVRWWKQTSKGPAFVKVGRRILYPEAELLAWIEKHTERTSA
jgi:excisionase family DNA binding protein